MTRSPSSILHIFNSYYNTVTVTRVVFLVLRLLAVGWERLQKARKLICGGGNGQQGEGKQQRTSLS